MTTKIKINTGNNVFLLLWCQKVFEGLKTVLLCNWFCFNKHLFKHTSFRTLEIQFKFHFIHISIHSLNNFCRPGALQGSRDSEMWQDPILSSKGWASGGVNYYYHVKQILWHRYPQVTLQKLKMSISLWSFWLLEFVV